MDGSERQRTNQYQEGNLLKRNEERSSGSSAARVLRQRLSVTFQMNIFADTTKSSDATLSRDTANSDQGLPNSYRVSTTPLLEKLYRGLTCRIRLLPDFLIIGTQRGGTTSLYHYLEAYPSIKPASTKELHFFDRRFEKGLSWYRGHFPTKIEKYYAQHIHGRAFVTGEASPSYLLHPHVPKRVAQALPQVKLIVLLRNPVDRAYSQYYHAIGLGYETLTFEEAIKSEEKRTAREREKILENEYYESHAYKHLSYLSRGIYVDQLQVWMDLFPREQFLILKSEDFYANPATALKQVLVFLGVSEAEAELRMQTYKQYNNKTSSKIDAGLRKRLIEYFEPHNARLYDLLGVNFGWDE